ncbi:MAG: cytosol nonspecific dipeptidase [Candidatus Fluviicola riflensis]|nr:MAG: cytosol nonspecific dipeptidase [Candidatus Fluviicola riflensis]OGS79571.1 MAG: cytosol nonspecific dipeptidase [Candidatus Fluviicola riflensis]OGS87002.1 MAG: cytosol nonspecific dipeptidase [Fluviicola sp. RIFCSPHIGHO2_01_FULL_43_53]OGS89793.1 MAG: cytosol nonspecific dipeptidase [Fluviicola sp. RIFCSPHIGHO2_12_FULL_43_24]
MEVRNLEPNALWNHFADLNAVPRPSKKEERVIQFMKDFGQSLGLETIEDHIGNVIIKKPATAGMEDRQTIVMQSHLDMVHQKNETTVFDFDTQGIEMLVDGDWVRAKGTTLGADNGIGVAAIMSVLASKEIAHPAIEALFTIDEETGMTGAMKIDPKNISGTILLNLDTEDDDELSIGCAGGIDTNTSMKLGLEPVNQGSVVYEIKLRGLLGGHSGMDIHLGRANANKCMNRLLYHLVSLVDLQLIGLEGGSLRNAIPRESTVIIAVPKDDKAAFMAAYEAFTQTINSEYVSIETEMTWTITETSTDLKAVVHADFERILNAIYAVPNGVFRMSPDIAGLVEASTSLAKISLADGKLTTQSLQRSSVESTKADVANAVRAAFESAGSAVVQNGEYPGWQPNPNSAILTVMADLYRTKFKDEPQIKACHAGLECGILGDHFPGMDMISFGPNIRGAHSPDECVQVSSVQKFWSYLLDVLQAIPAKTN